MLESLNPAIVSALALALGAVSLLGTEHSLIKKFKWPTIIPMICIGGLSIALQAHQELQDEKEKTIQRNASEEQKRDLLGKINSLTSRIEDLQRNKVFHPQEEPPIRVVSTYVDPTIQVGQPRRLQFTIQNTTNRILFTRNRAMSTMIYVDNFNYFVQNSEAGEALAYKRLLAMPLAGQQEIPTANGGQYDFQLETKNLNSDEVADFRTGKVVIYFLGEIVNAATQKQMFAICAFVAPSGQIFTCHKHNFP